MDQYRSDQTEEQESSASPKRSWQEKRCGSHTLDRADDAGVEIGRAQVEHGMDAAPEQCQAQHHMEANEDSLEALAMGHEPPKGTGTIDWTKSAVDLCHRCPLRVSLWPVRCSSRGSARSESTRLNTSHVEISY